MYTDIEMHEAVATKTIWHAEANYMEEVFYKKIKVAWSLIYTLPGVPPPIRRSVLDSYVDTPFADEIPLIEMARKFSFQNMRLYDINSDPDNHVDNEFLL